MHKKVLYVPPHKGFPRWQADGTCSYPNAIESQMGREGEKELVPGPAEHNQQSRIGNTSISNEILAVRSCHEEGKQLLTQHSIYEQLSTKQLIKMMIKKM